MKMHHEHPLITGPLDVADEPPIESPEQAHTAASGEAQACATEAAESIARHFAWTGPLLESALLCEAVDRKPLLVMTEWGGCDSPQHPDPDKHAAYSAHMLQTIQQVYPWLLPLLNSSRIAILLSPGTCCFTAPSRPGIAFEIPQLLPMTELTPFTATATDTLH